MIHLDDRIMELILVEMEDDVIQYYDDFMCTSMLSIVMVLYSLLQLTSYNIVKNVKKNDFTDQ